MICPECNGYKNFVLLAGTPFEVVRPCKRCNGTGEIKVTNEAWLNTLSTTEEKAEALTKVVLNIVSWNNDPKPSEVRDILKSWLKQPCQSVTNCNE